MKSHEFSRVGDCHQRISRKSLCFLHVQISMSVASATFVDLTEETEQPQSAVVPDAPELSLPLPTPPADDPAESSSDEPDPDPIVDAVVERIDAAEPDHANLRDTRSSPKPKKTPPRRGGRIRASELEALGVKRAPTKAPRRTTKHAPLMKSHVKPKRLVFDDDD